MFYIEVTDTFGGEPNYCWVKRGTTQASSRRGLINAAKTLAGWHGWCRVHYEDLGHVIVVRPTLSSGVCQIAFITWGA